MLKLNKVLYKKLLLQAEEAKDQNDKKLANAILHTIGSMSEDEEIEYSYSDLKSDIYEGLWKLSGYLMKYYDLKSVDAEKINSIIEPLSNEFIEILESELEISSSTIGPLEPKTPGESK
jgi:hypothetical protein